jgi:putative colanic acid biosynthesis acetyltransferase WcaF
MGTTRLDTFDATKGLERGRPKWVEALWYIVKVLLFLSPWPWPSSLKCRVLRAFGARVGQGVVIRPRVNIHLPWKLVLGDHCWVGEEVFLHSLERIEIGAHVCLSQRAFLCTGNHDFRDPAFSYRNAPIRVEDGAWLGAATLVCPGVAVGREAVLTAGSVATADLPPNMICAGHPAAPVKPRWRDNS